MKWTLNYAEAAENLTRSTLRLMNCEFEIVHRAGIKSQAANALLRLNTVGTDDQNIDNFIPIMVVATRVQSRQSRHICATPPALCYSALSQHWVQKIPRFSFQTFAFTELSATAQKVLVNGNTSGDSADFLALSCPILSYYRHVGSFHEHVHVTKKRGFGIKNYFLLI